MSAIDALVDVLVATNTSDATHTKKVQWGWCTADGKEIDWRWHQQNAKWTVIDGGRIRYLSPHKMRTF